jgi:hypothetical protein
VVWAARRNDLVEFEDRDEFVSRLMTFRMRHEFECATAPIQLHLISCCTFVRAFLSGDVVFIDRPAKNAWFEQAASERHQERSAEPSGLKVAGLLLPCWRALQML